MHVPHDGPNSAFHLLGPNNWIEVFHSRPSWAVSQISYRKDDEEWVPFGRFQLIDASDIRPGFRVFRIEAKRLEFRLASSPPLVVDSNSGMNYIVNEPGRYVLESGNGCRRVSDAQISDCLRAKRPKDRFVELSFRRDPSWRKCYVNYADEASGYKTWRSVLMKMVGNHDCWFQRLEIDKGIRCAFTDGCSKWDSNESLNYHICLPGMYRVGSGSLTYKGRSQLDTHRN